MKKIIKLFYFFIVVFVFSSNAQSDNYQASTTTIDGMGFWAIWENTSNGVSQLPVGTIAASLKFGFNHDFAEHCDGKSKIYIYGYPKLDLTCIAERDTYSEKPEQVVNPREFSDILENAKAEPLSNDGQKTFYVIINGFNNFKTDGEVFFVTKKNFNSDVIYPEAESADALPKEIYKLVIEKQALVDGALDKHSSENVKDITRIPDYMLEGLLGGGLVSEETPMTASIAIKDNKKLYIVPSLFRFTDGMSGDIISAVILNDGKQYQFIGHIVGCVRSYGPDLDGDNVPEIRTRSCIEGEGSTSIYFKVWPEIKELVTHEHS